MKASPTAWLRCAAVLASTSIIALAAFAPAAARAAEIVDAAYVEAALGRGAVVWDVRDARAYAEGHVPGAVNVGDFNAAMKDPHREDWLPTPQVQALLGNAGIDINRREVIVYSRQGDPAAYHALSAIRHFGGTSAAVFHGGIDAWSAAGKPLSKQATVLPPVTLTLAVKPGEAVWNAEMIERVKSGRTQIVDTRTPAEFAGDDVRAIRGGHIPGALSLPYEQNWVDPEAAIKLAQKKVSTRDGMALRPTDDLRKLYSGLDRDKEVIVYCQSGVRASVTATVLRELGFKDVKLYEPSWLGYAGVLQAPAEREVFVNVGALNGRIGALQSRVVELEAELGKLKAPR